MKRIRQLTRAQATQTTQRSMTKDGVHVSVNLGWGRVWPPYANEIDNPQGKCMTMFI